MYLSERDHPKEVASNATSVHNETHKGQSLVDDKKVPTAIYLLGMTSLLTDISSEMVASILPIYLFTVLNLSPMQFGVVDGLFNGSTALVRLLSAYVADCKNKHKTVAFLGYFLSALSRLAMLFAGFAGVTSVAGILLLDRIGKGIRTAPRDAMVAAHASPGRVAQAFGVHRAMDAAGAVIGPLLATGILIWMPQRFDVIFMSSFCFATLGLLVLGVCVKPSASNHIPHHKLKAEQLANPAITFALTLQAFKSRSYLKILAASTVLAIFTLSDNMIYLGLHKRGSLSMQYVPLCFAATGLIFMLLAVPIGKIADRVGGMRIFLLGYASLGLLYTLFAFIPSIGYLDIVFCIVLLGLYYACTDGLIMAMAAQQLPIHARATGLACLATVISLGRLVSSILFGWLWQSSSQAESLMLFGGAMFTVLIVFLWVVKN